MKKVYFVLALLLVTMLALETLNVYLANKVSEKSVELGSNQKLLEEVIQENTRLQFDILKNSNFARVASRAALLGFTDAPEVISLYDPLELAIRNEVE